jgi:hypothetical protein
VQLQDSHSKYTVLVDDVSTVIPVLISQIANKRTSRGSMHLTFAFVLIDAAG